MPVTDERTDRVARAVIWSGGDWGLITSADGVHYATGLESALHEGPSPHVGGPATALVGRDGATLLIVSDVEEAAARASRADEVLVYEAFAPRPHPGPLDDWYTRTLLAAAKSASVTGVIAAEMGSTPMGAHDALATLGCAFVDIGPALRRVRATKTREEIDRLRSCAALTGVGQAAFREHAAPGLTEIELLGLVRTSMEISAGGPLTMGADLVSGPERTAEGTGGPTDRVLREGDAVICDLWPRLGGYWGDSCSSLVLGEPSPPQVALFSAASAALARAVEVLRPGIRAGDLDAAVRAPILEAGFEDPLHTGHGIGAANFEYPRIVPGATQAIEEDMVLMIEPGAHDPVAGGIRLEWMLRVTADGAEILSPYAHTLAAPSLAGVPDHSKEQA